MKKTGLTLAKTPRLWMAQAALILLAAWYVFSPSVRGGWLWDDHEIRNNPTLHSWDGLGKIWTAPAATDYLPVEATVLWAAWHAWGDATAGYHVLSIALDVLSAFLLWRLLAKLGVRFAWVGGLLFVVHPMAVESVAWISEIKNTLSLPLMLLSLLAYLKYEESFAAKKYYGAALVLFLLAMLSKSSVVMFPAILLLYSWWKRGRVGRRDLLAALPFFAVAVVLAAVTVHFQDARAIRDWRVPAAPWLARAGGAGLALAFYFGKAVFPVDVMPIYPGWSVSPMSLVAFVPWVVFLAIVFALSVGLWVERTACLGEAQRRRVPRTLSLRNSGGVVSARGTVRSTYFRTILVGLGFFVINLVPVLGFIPMAYQHIAPVADHLAYISLAGMAGLAAAGLGALRLPKAALGIAAGAVLAILAYGSHLYAGVFTDQQAMWTYNAEHNTRSAAVFSNLAFVQNRDGQPDAAVRNYERAARLDPGDPEIEDELAGVLADQNQTAEALPHYQRAIDLYKGALRADPDLRDANNKLGLDLVAVGRTGEAMGQFEEAVRKNPRSYEDQTNLANVLVGEPGRLQDAILHFQAAERINPGSDLIHRNLGYALAAAHRYAEARDQFREALRIDPADTTAKAWMDQLP